MAKNEAPKVYRQIPYRYICEHCGAQTEWKNASISGESDTAIDQQEIPKAIKEAQSGNYFALNNIKGKCEKCGRHQSWELGEAKAFMRRAPLMGLALVGTASIALFILFGLLGALAVFVLGTLGCFIFGLVSYLRVKSDVSKTNVRHSPEVIWSAQAVPQAGEQPQMLG